MGRKKFSADFQLMFRLLKLILFIGFIVTLVIMFVFLSLTVGDIFSSLLAFLPTGWALLQVHILFYYNKHPYILSHIHSTLNLYTFEHELEYVYIYIYMLCELMSYIISYM